MGFLKIDQNKCNQDRLCVEECPRQIIRMEEGGYPYVAPEDEAYCMVCGHCVAICPKGAVNLDKVPVEACPPLDRSLNLSWDQAAQFLRSRRSIRWYKDKEVDQVTLRRLIELARYAPTASNSQTIHWTVISGRDKLFKLSEMTAQWMRDLQKEYPGSPAALYFAPVVAKWDQGEDGILRTASTLIVASAPEEATNGLVDSTIALTYLELMALTLGLGTCWAGLLHAAMVNRPAVLEQVGLPQGHTVHYPMMIGYPRFKYQRLPERNQPPIHWK